jgi:hypothetical protein
VAEVLLPMVPAVALNVCHDCPLRLTLPGTGSNPLLLLKFTVAVPVGTPFNVTMQVMA